MDKDSMKDVPRNMRLTGMFLFRSALMEASRGRIPMCVVHTAHAAEILLKARIAQEHPLLIFSKLPKSESSKDPLTLMNLLESGRTLTYEELPDQLWATTGIKIERLNQYREFGRLRNQIIHLSMTNTKELDLITIRYSFELLDPLVESFWGRSVIDFIRNDPHPRYSDYDNLGSFVDSINEVYPIDERLRCLLGEDGINSWKQVQYDKEQWEEEQKRWESLTNEEKDEYVNEHYVDTPISPETEEILEADANWKNFLESF